MSDEAFSNVMIFENKVQYEDTVIYQNILLWNILRFNNTCKQTHKQEAELLTY
jgi:hypothetical protein